MMMKSALLWLFVTFAGAAQAQDWSGFYAGLSFGTVDGTYRHYDSGVISPANTDPIDGRLNGGFIGYNLQSGNFVYGGELAFGNGDLLVGGNPIYFVEDTLDVRARVGYAFDWMLVYGTIGRTMAAHHWDDGNVSNSPVRVDGTSLGLGVDFQATDRIIVGLAYQHVRLVAEEGEIGNFPLVEANDELDLVTFRVGFRF